MRIARIVIKKFRSIDQADLWVSSINAIVGQNNSGKSCLLRALNCFFNYEAEIPAFETGQHQYTSKSISKIQIHFEDCSPDATPAKYTTNGKLIVECSYRLTKGSGCTRAIHYRKNGSWVNDDKALDAVKDQLEFILVPTNRDAIALERMESNVLRTLVEYKMQEATENRDNYTSRFRSAINYLESHALDEIAKAAKNQFPINRQLTFRVRYKKSISYTDFLKDVGIDVEEKGQTHSLVDCGSGIQSLTIIALYNLLAAAREEKIIVALEEPETNLHPQAQKELIDHFKGMIKEGNISQFFLTTHSANMVDQVDHTDVILFRKVHDTQRGFKSSIRRLPKDFFERYDLDDFKYYQFHKYRNSDFFFSSYIVVTESKNELEVIKAIGSRAGIDYEKNGLSYLNLEGVGRAKYAVFLLKELEIPYLLIVDKDFFLDYSNDEYLKSLSTQGFPSYKKTYADKEFVKVLIHSAQDRADLLEQFSSNHSRAQVILDKYNIICMRYSLDLDLAAIPRAQEEYFNMLNVLPVDRNSSYLTTRPNAIKKIARILQAFSVVPSGSWPHSYSRIKNKLKKITASL